ncbi:unnamed protein product [Parnassius mnemosyne]|uniref:G2/M phase-specific E3 ubiquitin-protein ligase n=1 Tax=Parnassius mnemosyne TaxID=213953 RepID=A0AAV1LBQ6_9NEOP
MSSKKGGKTKKHLLLAKLVTGKKAPCVFCQRNVDDEIIYGKLYAIGDIQCHYFCVLLSCCLVQKGNDEDGLFGFLYPDIIAEVERSKKHKCSYCGRDGATLGCSVSQCRKQFHLPCGRERDAVSLFYGNYKTYCHKHAPKQKINDEIMAKVKLRSLAQRKIKQLKNQETIKKKILDSTTSCVNENKTDQDEEQKQEMEAVCVICYETVDGYPTLRTFWPPCCARDAWFHRSCLQRMALSAGMHYLKCPLCNEKEVFYKAVLSQGYYVPDRDAAWELEQNAFSEIYERPVFCAAPECCCPMGRDHDADTGAWDMLVCVLCGSSGMHEQCRQQLQDSNPDAPRANRYVCAVCAPVAPEDIDTLAECMETVVLQGSPQEPEERRGVPMPSRMSLRRTKPRTAPTERASSSNTQRNGITIKTEKEEADEIPKSDITASRLELNLKPPKKPPRGILEPLNTLKDIENILISPLKMFEQGLYERISQVGIKDLKLDSNQLVEQMRERFRKPRPLVEKKKIINNILESIFESLHKDKTKTKEPIKEWNSPKKYSDSEMETIEKILKENNDPSTEQNQVDIEGIDNNINPPIMLNKETIDLIDENAIIDSGDVQYISKQVERDDETKETDDSSNSTFQLPPEFIAEENSNASLPIFDTPKKFKPVHIQKDSSMEISKNNETVNIDVVKLKETETKSDFITNLDIKSPFKANKCAYKFSPLDKEVLQSNKLDIDVECFKNHYLNEIDKDFKCTFNHQHVENEKTDGKLTTAIDFAVNAYNKEKKEQTAVKRKIPDQEAVPKKKRRVAPKKKVHIKCDKSEIKVKCSTKKTGAELESVGLKVKEKKRLRKHKVSIRNKDIQVKIKWKKEQLRLKITESKRNVKRKKTKKSPSKTLKQYVLKYSPNIYSKGVIARPEHEVTPIRKKHVKCEKTPDNLVQTSIASFFKTKPPPN